MDQQNLPLSSEETPKAPSLREIQKTQRGEAIFHLSEGWVSNPLHSGKIRNNLCICGSGKKVKKCCGKDPIIRDPRMSYSTSQRHKVKDSKYHEEVATSSLSV